MLEDECNTLGNSETPNMGVESMAQSSQPCNHYLMTNPMSHLPAGHSALFWWKMLPNGALKCGNKSSFHNAILTIVENRNIVVPPIARSLRSLRQHTNNTAARRAGWGGWRGDRDSAFNRL